MTGLVGMSMLQSCNLDPRLSDPRLSETNIGTCPTCRTISTLNILMLGRGTKHKHQHCSCGYVGYMVMSHFKEHEVSLCHPAEIHDAKR